MFCPPAWLCHWPGRAAASGNFHEHVADVEHGFRKWPLLASWGNRFEGSTSLANAKRLVYLKLMEKDQNTDSFKLIICSRKIGEQTPQMTSRDRREPAQDGRQ